MLRPLMIKLNVPKHKYIKVLLLSLFLFLSGYLFINNVKADETGLKAEKYNTKTDKLITPTKKNINESLTLIGFVDADQIANLRFQASGELVWVGVKVGDRVKKGQAIASLDKEKLKKTLQKEANNYLTNRWTFEDVQDTYKQTKENYLITDEIQRILDRQQFSLNNAVLDYELANLALKYSVLTSPIDGIITQIDTPNAGVNITPLTADFIVINPNSIFFSSEVDEEDVNKLSLGQFSKISIDSIPNQIFDSEIYHISFTPISGKSSTVYLLKFKLNVDNQNLTYRLGMNGDVNIILSQATDTITIPIEALIENDSKQYVLVKEDKNTRLIEIKTGIESEEDIQVLEGLSGNEQIIVKG